MTAPDDAAPLSRTAAQTAVEASGWRLLVGALLLDVPVGSFADGCAVAAAAAAAAGDDADAHLRADVRHDRVVLTVQTRTLAAVTGRDVALAGRVSAALAAAPADSPGTPSPRRPQQVEIGIDALDIPAVRRFWKAVTGYVDDVPWNDGTLNALVDPAGRGASIWFQQMDAPRPQRNRIHLDVVVAHDEGEPRVAAALAAGGRLVSDARARAFWVLADAEGNEACVCTWLDRDPQEA